MCFRVKHKKLADKKEKTSLRLAKNLMCKFAKKIFDNCQYQYKIIIENYIKLYLFTLKSCNIISDSVLTEHNKGETHSVLDISSLTVE